MLEPHVVSQIVEGLKMGHNAQLVTELGDLRRALEEAVKITRRLEDAAMIHHAETVVDRMVGVELAQALDKTLEIAS